MSRSRLSGFLALFSLLLASISPAAEFVVTSPAGDHADNTLGWAVDQANLTTGADTIRFDIPVTGSGPAVILPQSEYVLSDPGTLIDGWSQPGSIQNTNPAPGPLNSAPAVVVDGSMISTATASYAVFRIETNDVVIRGLNVRSGPLYEIAICMFSVGCSSNRVQGCFLGTDENGTTSRPSGWLPWNPPYGAGVMLSNRATDNIIGSEPASDHEAAERNLISGERPADSQMVGFGVLLDARGSSVDGNLVAGNLIGTDVTAGAALSNNYGIAMLNGAVETAIENNVIAGNTFHGVYSWTNTVSENLRTRLVRNYIGIDPNAVSAVPNGGDGIHLDGGCASAEIGTGDWLEANVVSGNTGDGIRLGSNSFGDAAGNTISGNLVGTDISGAAAVPNGGSGVHFLETAGGNRIGIVGSPSLGNVISGNAGHGVWLEGSSLDRVDNNVIGWNFVGDSAVANGQDGIYLTCSGAAAAACPNGTALTLNRIGHNLGHGIALFGALTSISCGPDNTIEFNGGAGLYANGPGSDTVLGSNAVAHNDFSGIHLVGASPTIQGNTLAENVQYGIRLEVFYGSDASPASAADDRLSRPAISGNTFDNNGNGGIYSLDTEAPNGRSLHTDNSFTTSTRARVQQLWRAAFEVLDSSLVPITSGAYTLSATGAAGSHVSGDQPSGGLWGPAGFDATNANTWLLVTGYRVAADGTFVEENPYTVAAVGPTSGQGGYTFDGLDDDVSQGGAATGILTGGLLRYQVAEVVTELDSDSDGTPDADDCAPVDPAFQGASGVSCDADGDGWCDATIAGGVQHDACPNDPCATEPCTPTDCDDTLAATNPAASEISCDSLDNDCNAATGDDPDPTDADGDGYTLGCGADCDDGAIAVHPGATEIECDDIDNDCDSGTADDPDPTDGDSDGYTLGCGQDCDDSNPNAHPGATEGPPGDATCSDGADNDCDGDTDGEDPACVPVSTCGDGVVEGTELCDDSNLTPGDGCSELCAIEAGWACRPGVAPSLCGSAASAGEIVVTEIMQNPGCVSDTSGEWFEIHNTTDRTLVLRGWLLTDLNTTPNRVVLSNLSIAPDAYAVLCRNADPAINGGITCDVGYGGSFVLGNSADAILVRDPVDTLIDQVAYDGGPQFPNPTGASMSLDPAADATANDSGANWCTALTTIPGGCGDLGTPGQANPECGTCLDADGDGHAAETCGGDDCDDSDPGINPGVSEGPPGDTVCSDGVDNDCDGLTDAADIGCTAGEICGNGLVQTGEDCDDGNVVDADGCSSACLVESGWVCRAGVEPSLCGSQAAAGEAVVTEIMNNPTCTSDATGEWFELRNASSRALQLRGWLVSDDGSDNSLLGSFLLPAGGLAVICRNGDPAVNGGVDCDLTASFTLANGLDEVVVSDPADTVIDRVAYDDGATFPDPAGASMSLHAGLGALDNDQGSNWCEASRPIPAGCGDLGTPGATNGSCFGGCVDGDSDGHEDVACGGDDCNDADPGIYPTAPETCDDGIDQDCNGLDLECGCGDSDGDGFPDVGCGGNDCDDTAVGVNPGATEICGDDIDQDCNGFDLPCGCQDADGDGYEDQACGGDDCDDTAAAVNPGAAEVCDNGLDDDCDEATDTADSECGTCPDVDEDGYEDAACGGDDCDDTAPAIHPGAAEVCDNGLDDDCDGLTDSQEPVCQSTCPDLDDDGYSRSDCGGTDCDDGNPLVHPGAAEVCGDGLDNDCDGALDANDTDCPDSGSGGCGCATPPGIDGALWCLLALAGLRRRRS